MDNLFFYNTLTDKIKENSALKAEDYYFSYTFKGSDYPLDITKRNGVILLKDSTDFWKIETSGLNIERTILIEYPDALKGKEGIAPANSELNICTIWTCPSLKQTGYILPSVTRESTGWSFSFKHSFPEGEVKGSLELKTIFYLSKVSPTPTKDEDVLMNEAGVTLGTIDEAEIQFDNNFYDFPIKEISDSKVPLWWLELNNWEDPTSDMFDDSTVCIYLNTANPACPNISATTKNNKDMLIEILTETYLMIFLKLKEMDYLEDTKKNINLEQGSISSFMYYFMNSCFEPLDFNSIDKLQLTIRKNIEFMLKGGN